MFKRIPGLEDYFVSEDGDIMSTKYTKVSFLHPRKNNRGYLCISLFCGGRAKTFPIHRLVAMAFLPNYDETLEVNHKDCNKLNNNVTNLELVTHKQNIRHANQNNLMNHPKGEKHYAAKLSEEQVLEIKRMYSKYGLSRKFFAKRYNVSSQVIDAILTGKSWKSVNPFPM